MKIDYGLSLIFIGYLIRKLLRIYVVRKIKGRKMTPMTEAFDTKVLSERLAAKGLPVLETAVKESVEVTLTWIEESLVLTPSKVDDVGIPIIEGLKPFVMAQLDKIS